MRGGMFTSDFEQRIELSAIVPLKHLIRYQGLRCPACLAASDPFVNVPSKLRPSEVADSVCCVVRFRMLDALLR